MRTDIHGPTEHPAPSGDPGTDLTAARDATAMVLVAAGGGGLTGRVTSAGHLASTTPISAPPPHDATSFAPLRVTADDAGELRPWRRLERPRVGAAR